jgi:hypothetical protein
MGRGPDHRGAAAGTRLHLRHSANQIWSFTGWGPQNVNASYLQPFVNYTTKTYTTFAVNTESTYDWQAANGRCR